MFFMVYCVHCKCSMHVKMYARLFARAAGFSDDVTASCGCNTNLKSPKLKTLPLNFSIHLECLGVLSSVDKRKKLPPAPFNLTFAFIYVMGYRPGQ